MVTEPKDQLERTYYRPRPLSAEQCEQLRAFMEDTNDRYMEIYREFRHGWPSEGAWRETWLTAHTKELAEVFKLLHEGWTPEAALGSAYRDFDLEVVSEMAPREILKSYREFRIKDRIRPWDEYVALADRIELTRAAIRWRLRGHTICRIADRDVLRVFPKRYPDGVSRETVRRILKRYGLNKRNFRVTAETFELCRSDELGVERALMSYVKRNGGYLPSLSENNGSISRSHTRRRLLASASHIQTDLNLREKRRLWRQDLREWVAETASTVRDRAHARSLFNQKIDEWLSDPLMAEAFGAEWVASGSAEKWFANHKPDLLESRPRKWLESIFARPELAYRLGLRVALTSWRKTKREFARAILEQSPTQSAFGYC